MSNICTIPELLSATENQQTSGFQKYKWHKETERKKDNVWSSAEHSTFCDISQSFWSLPLSPGETISNCNTSRQRRPKCPFCIIAVSFQNIYKRDKMQTACSAMGSFWPWSKSCVNCFFPSFACRNLHLSLPAALILRRPVKSREEREKHKTSLFCFIPFICLGTEFTLQDRFWFQVALCSRFIFRKWSWSSTLVTSPSFSSVVIWETADRARNNFWQRRLCTAFNKTWACTGERTSCFDRSYPLCSAIFSENNSARVYWTN